MPAIRRRSGPATDHPTVVGFTVGIGGAIPEDGAPTKFVAAPNDIVLWAVGNQTQEQIRVTLRDFLLKDNDDDPKGQNPTAPDPFIWLVPFPVRVDAGTVGVIAGRRNPAYQTKTVFFVHVKDHLSYTIRVEGAFGMIDYDPDGDIKP
jgi:hypothetical protein